MVHQMVNFYCIRIFPDQRGNESQPYSDRSNTLNFRRSKSPLSVQMCEWSRWLGDVCMHDFHEQENYEKFQNIKNVLAKTVEALWC